MKPWTRVIPEEEFRLALREKVRGFAPRAVMGPGRSGAVAAVYASHVLGCPFIPFGLMGPANDGRPLMIIDTASESGRTMRKALRKYAEHNPIGVVVYHEPPRVKFWYEVRT